MASGDTEIDAKTVAHLIEALIPHVGAFAHPMVRRAARECASLADLIETLVAKVEPPEQRADFLKKARKIAMLAGVSGDTRSPRPAVARETPGRFPAEILEPIRAALAEYAGPVALLLVERALERAQSREQLVNLLSAEIPDNDARLAFVKRVSER